MENNREQERENRRRIIDDMTRLLTHSADEGLQWRGSKTDLLEMVHILYWSDSIRDADGLPATFKNLVCRVCGILHVTVPRNPSQLVCHARRRKGRRVLPLLKRYTPMTL